MTTTNNISAKSYPVSPLPGKCFPRGPKPLHNLPSRRSCKPILSEYELILIMEYQSSSPSFFAATLLTALAQCHWIWPSRQTPPMPPVSQEFSGEPKVQVLLPWQARTPSIGIVASASIAMFVPSRNPPIQVFAVFWAVLKTGNWEPSPPKRPWPTTLAVPQLTTPKYPTTCFAPHRTLTRGPQPPPG